MAHPVQQARFTFLDRNGNTATVSFWVPVSLSPVALLSALNTIADHLRAVSDAAITKVDVYRRIPYTPVGTAATTADMNSRIVLYYSNGDTYEAIWIPSPKAVLFESTGIYEGIRADATVEALIPWTVDASSTLAPTTTKEGEPFPVSFVVGGLML